MRTRNELSAGGAIVAAGALLAALLAIGEAAGQGRQAERRRDPEAEPVRPRSDATDRDDDTRSAPATRREGGIPRRELGREREQDRQDGQEEGVPDVQSRDRSPELQPRWIPPRGDGKLGVWAYNTDSGVVVTRVAPGSAAARIGIERGDRIVTVGGYQVGYVGDLLYPLGYEVRRHADGRGDVLLLVQNVRNSELMSLTTQLDRPDRPRSLPRVRQ